MSVSISTPSGRTMASAATVAPSATASQKSSASANPTALDRASARYRAAQSRYRQAKAALKAIKRQIVPVDAFGNRKPRLRGWLHLATLPLCIAASIVLICIAPAGSVVRPLPYFNNFGEPYAGHKGTDYMVDRGTPIYSIADGVVVASSENGPGWGVYVKIAHNIGGNTVTSLYAHMSYGTRRVVVGDTVRAGQIIGQVGDTGRAFGTHLHLEIYVNGSWTNAEDFLVANVH